MASRIMHYLIADLVAKELRIADYTRFTFGTLAPDLSSKEDGTYDKSHFGAMNIEQGTKGINWARFYDKYKDRMYDDFYLGYYIHLISDAIWYNTMYCKLIKSNYSKQERDSRIIKGYGDMRRSNGMLIRDFALKNTLMPIREYEVEEISYQSIDELIKAFNSDFEDTVELNYRFEIYQYTDIVSYIETCVRKCVHEINAVRNNTLKGNPEEFYAIIN